MAGEPQHMQLAEVVRDASKILDELQATNTELLLEDRGSVFRLVPKRTPKRHKRFSREDPLFALMGAFASAEEMDIARNKHEYLAQAYEDLHRI